MSQSMDGKTVWIIAGPTASGKSQLALDLARAANGVVINADSMQVYAEIPILSAQPDAAARAAVPHELYGIHPIAKNYSAASWAERAASAIDRAQADGRQPILVGGSGLYLRALVEGFSEMPGVTPSVRRHVTDLYDMLGPQWFHDALTRIDPAAAQRLHPTDRQRMIRAREIFESSQQTLSAWQARPKQNLAPHLTYRSVVLAPPRPWLHERINARFLQMIDQGALGEAAAVQRVAADEDATGLHALGLAALRDHLDGRLTLVEAVVQAQTQSRQYAKRQDTWFRNQPLPHRLVIAEDGEARLAQSLKHLLNT